MERARNPNFFRRALLVSALASVTVHGALEITDRDHAWELKGQNPIAVTEDVSTEVLGRYNAGDPYIIEETIEKTADGPAKIFKSETFTFVEGEYARKFDKDPAADKLDPEKISDSIAVIKYFEQQGFDDITVFLWGKTSAEDATQDGLAGVQTQSEDNDKLGIRRANTLREAIEAGLDDTDIEVNYVFLETDEDNFTNERIDNLLNAHESYSNLPELITSYNSGEFSNEMMKDNFDAYRGSANYTTATKYIEDADVPTQEFNKVCIKPQGELVRKDINQEHGDIPIPYGVAIMAGGLVFAVVADGVRLKRQQDKWMDQSRRSIEADRHQSIHKELTNLVGSGGKFDAEELPDWTKRLRQADVEAFADELPESTRAILTEAITERETRVNNSIKEQERRARKRGFKWLAGMVGAVLLGGGITGLVSQCTPKDTVVNYAPPKPSDGTDACSGADETRKIVVETKTVTYRDGRKVATEVQPVS